MAVVEVRLAVVLSARHDEELQVNGVPYNVLQIIGKGGSSKVYKVMCPDHKIFALKRVELADQGSTLTLWTIDNPDLFLILTLTLTLTLGGPF